jgi:uncharacterized membrane protein
MDDSGVRSIKSRVFAKGDEPRKDATTTAATGDDIVHVSGTFSGPLPPPSILAEYNGIDPELVNRIVSMAENQAAHRRSTEAELVTGSIFTQRMGMVCGVIVAMSVLIAATVMVCMNHPWPGSILGTGDLVAIVSVFVYGNRQRSNRARLSAPPETRALPATDAPKPEEKRTQAKQPKRRKR